VGEVVVFAADPEGLPREGLGRDFGRSFRRTQF